MKEDLRTRHIRVVVITGLGQEQAREKALAAGADGYLAKPFSPLGLLKKLEELSN